MEFAEQRPEASLNGGVRLKEVALEQLRHLLENCELAIGHATGWRIYARGIVAIVALALMAILAITLLR
jgi:hypothetical protein